MVPWYWALSWEVTSALRLVCLGRGPGARVDSLGSLLRKRCNLLRRRWRLLSLMTTALLLKASLAPFIEVSHWILVLRSEAIRLSSLRSKRCLSRLWRVARPSWYCSWISVFRSSSLASAKSVSGSLVIILFRWSHMSIRISKHLWTMLMAHLFGFRLLLL